MTKLPPNCLLLIPSLAFLLLVAVFALPADRYLWRRRLLGPNFDNQPTQAELLQARSDAIAAIPQLPKDTEEKLSGGAPSQLTPITAAFVDPLIDRFGLRSQVTKQMPCALTSYHHQQSPSGYSLTTPDKLLVYPVATSLRNANASGLPAPSITTAYLISEAKSRRPNHPPPELKPHGSTSNQKNVRLQPMSEPNSMTEFWQAIDRQGVVFRTSTGQTKLIQWDRQEEFSARPTTLHPPSVHNNTHNQSPHQKQQTH